MADAKLKILMDLEDRVSGQMQKIKTNLDNFQGKVKDLEPAFKKMAVVGTAGFAAIAVAVALSVNAYVDSEKQLTRVDAIMKTLSENTLKTMGGSIDTANQKAQAFGATLQALGGIGDEDAAEGVAKLTQITGDFTKAQDAARIAADLATFKQIDYGTAVDAIGKVLTGNVGVLKKMGIEIDENMSKEDAMIALQKRVGGQYEAYGKTVAGQMAIIKQSFGDIQENIGKAFIPALTSALKSIKPVIDNVVAWTAANPELVKNIAIVGLAVTGLIAAIGTLGLVIGPIIAGIAFLTTAIAFIVSPIGLVIVAIGALIAIGVLLYQHWDQVKAAATSLWSTVVAAWDGMINGISDAMLRAAASISAAWETIKNVFWISIDIIIGAWASLLDFLVPGWDTALAEIWAKAVEIFTSITTYFSTVFASWKITFLEVLNTIKVLWSTVWNEVKVVFTTVWDAITAGVKAAYDTISSLMGQLVAPIQKVIDLAERAMSLAGGVAGKVGSAVGSGISAVIERGRSITGRAVGGPVSGGTPYIVGENGPEMFVPGMSGSIIPNRSMGGTQINLTITGNSFMGREGVAQEIGDEIIKQLGYRMKLKY